MNGEANISGFMTVAQAADALALSAHQVRALAASGEIEASKLDSRTILCDAASVVRYKLIFQGKGRPLSAEIAFSALGALSGKPVEGLSYQAQRRLRQKLLSIDAKNLVWQARRRKTTKHYYCDESFFPKLADRISLSGGSALDGFDLTSSASKLEGYAERVALKRIVDRFFLEEDPQGNVSIHVCDKNPWADAKTMPFAVVASDLAESLNTRERDAGLDCLERLLDEYRNAQNERVDYAAVALA